MRIIGGMSTNEKQSRQWGATLGFYAPRGYYSSPEARAEIDALAATGANWVVVVATVWQDEATSASQYRDCALTPDDLELAEIVAYARSKGLKVQQRPMLECKDGLGRLDVRLPRDAERMAGRRSTARRDWFASMAERTACYASLARRMGCDAFCLDSELDNMTEENDLWKTVVAAARREYPGPVTSCHTVHTGKVDFAKHLADPDHWFHSLDFLSLSYYCRAREEADRGRDLSVGDMMKRLSGAHAKVEAIAKALGKPVVFGECGCGSIRDGAATPSWFSPFAEADEEEQARYMDALFGVFAREDWCLGFHWWKWDQHSPVKPGATLAQARARDFTIRGKKAEGVFSRWARGNSAHGDTAFPMAAGAASPTTTKETHGENHELHK